jgi:diaminopimelate epimerase
MGDELRFTKGHGTENDFVLVADPDGELDLSPATVAALCDRRAGIGGDGLIRVVRSKALAEGEDSLAEDENAEWFMDYRNADGSLAEMCGNGVRVFAAYLQDRGLIDSALLGSTEGLVIGTRAGVRRVRHAVGPAGEPGWFSVDMGRWRLPGGPAAVSDGFDAEVLVAGLGAVARPGLSVDLGNPHTVVALPDGAELDAADLLSAPAVQPVPRDGTNVELIVMEPPTGSEGRLRMRVHERGVGETRSCGTGACAAALAEMTWGGPQAPETWLVDVPGGQVRVRALPDQGVELAGPARLVADGVVHLASLKI